MLCYWAYLRARSRRYIRKERRKPGLRIAQQRESEAISVVQVDMPIFRGSDLAGPAPLTLTRTRLCLLIVTAATQPICEGGASRVGQASAAWSAEDVVEIDRRRQARLYRWRRRGKRPRKTGGRLRRLNGSPLRRLRWPSLRRLWRPRLRRQRRIPRRRDIPLVEEQHEEERKDGPDQHAREDCEARALSESRNSYTLVRVVSWPGHDASHVRMTPSKRARPRRKRDKLVAPEPRRKRGKLVAPEPRRKRDKPVTEVTSSP